MPESTMPSFEEFKNLPDNDVPYIHKMVLPEARGQHRLMKMGNMAISDGQLEVLDKRIHGMGLRHFNDMPLIEMNFTLSGHTLQKQGYLKEEVVFTEGYHNVMFNAGEWEQNRFVGEGVHNNFTISILAERFIQLFASHSTLLDNAIENIIAGRPFTIQQPGQSFTPYMHAIIHSIWNCPLQGGLKKLYMETKMMELLLLQCELFAPRVTVADILKNKDDIDKIYLAREILLKEIQHPPSLTQLSRLCGLNEFKLKRGFKQIFNNTVFGYLNARRLEQAQTLILDNQMTLSEIAIETGFSHPQHFSRAFKKHFGVTPGSLTR